MSKAPKLQPGAMAGGMTMKVPTAEAGRSDWQKARELRMALREEFAAKASTPDNSSARTSGESDALAAGWLKQRIATELLGDTLTAPWEIDDTALFERLASLIKGTSATGTQGSDAELEVGDDSKARQEENQRQEGSTLP